MCPVWFSTYGQVCCQIVARFGPANRSRLASTNAGQNRSTKKVGGRSGRPTKRGAESARYSSVPSTPLPSKLPRPTISSRRRLGTHDQVDDAAHNRTERGAPDDVEREMCTDVDAAEEHDHPER